MQLLDSKQARRFAEFEVSLSELESDFDSPISLAAGILVERHRARDDRKMCSTQMQKLHPTATFEAGRSKLIGQLIGPDAFSWRSLAFTGFLDLQECIPKGGHLLRLQLLEEAIDCEPP